MFIPTANWPEYSVVPLGGMDELRELFPDSTADAYKWCLLNIGGMMATGVDLATTERWLRGELTPDERAAAADEPLSFGPYKVDALVIHPRRCTLRSGHIEVTLDDLPFLRALASTSLQAITASQIGNV